MENKKIGLILLIIGAILLIGGVPAAQMASISFSSELGTVTAEGLSPYSVAFMFAGIVLMIFGVYLRKK